MNKPTDTIERDGYKVEVFPDECPISPREYAQGLLVGRRWGLNTREDLPSDADARLGKYAGFSPADLVNYLAGIDEADTDEAELEAPGDDVVEAAEAAAVIIPVEWRAHGSGQYRVCEDKQGTPAAEVGGYIFMDQAAVVEGYGGWNEETRAAARVAMKRELVLLDAHYNGGDVVLKLSGGGFEDAWNSCLCEDYEAVEAAALAMIDDAKATRSGWRGRLRVLVAWCKGWRLVHEPRLELY